ncbi:TPA: Hsp20/alpha crystallin family protein [Candidatus Bathyarchaeota archaeon]|nr:Hsp20/alpha crystallin family protein [Candidatus Bathyarchaeota archaeon]
MERKERKSIFERMEERLREMEEAIRAYMPVGWDESSSSIEPLHNVLLKSDEVVVTIDLPYVDLNRIEVRAIEDDRIEVLARTKQTICLGNFGLKHRSGEFTCYHTVIRIPAPVDRRKLTYKLKKGILEIHLPRV